MPYKGNYTYLDVDLGLTVNGVQITGSVYRTSTIVDDSTSISKELTILSNKDSILTDKTFTLPAPILGAEFRILNTNSTHKLSVKPFDDSQRINRTLTNILLKPGDTIKLCGVSDKDWWIL